MSSVGETWEKLQSEAQTLRDEIRVKLHLGGMDIRDGFQKFEKEAEHLAQKVGHDAEGAWTSLVDNLKKMRDGLTSAKPADAAAKDSKA